MMDYQNNDMNTNNSEEENWDGQLEMWQVEKPKTKMGLGILIGALSTLFLTGLMVGAVCMLTNTTIVFKDRTATKQVVSESQNAVLNEESVRKINELTAYAKLYYYDDIDVEEVRDGMYYGLIEGLDDKYSVYYNEEDVIDLQVSTTGQYYGIGAGLAQDLDTMVVTITKVYEGTPSEAAGLKENDVIISVEDIDATSMEVSELVNHIRGEAGTCVHLEIYRPSTGEYLGFDVERADVTLPSVEHAMLENQIGYIWIYSFEKETANQFNAAVDDLTEQGMQALVLDVRDNPGGMLGSVVAILDDILPEGLLVYTEDKMGNRENYTSSAKTYMDLPIAVLINENSASAAEILAGAMKDHEYGTLIGTTTFGKGVVQTIFPLQNGDAVKLTTAKYFTPSGNYIHEVGIEPDIELEYEYLNPEGTEYEKKYDNQILKAVEILTEQLEGAAQ